MYFKVFTKTDCVWCKKAKELLKQEKFYYEEYIYPDDFTKEYLLSLLGLPEGGRLTLPQIFMDDDYKITHIGGFKELEKYLKSHPYSEV